VSLQQSLTSVTETGNRSSKQISKTEKQGTDLPLAFNKNFSIRLCQIRQVTLTVILEHADYYM
jgi:hypothetical protein